MSEEKKDQSEINKEENSEDSIKKTDEASAEETDEAAKAKEERKKAREERAKARAAAKEAEGGEKSDDASKEERAKARAERAKARAAAKAEESGEGEESEKPKEPSFNQPYLDRMVEIIKKEISEDCVKEAYVNELDMHLPTVYINHERWVETSNLLKSHQEMDFNYLRNVSGVDHETHMEVVFHFLSLNHRKELCVKVKTDRDQPSVPSVTPLWSTANWNEREIYDLFGIDFPGHPDMRRIMMSDDWVGHPLRKDYEPLDPEV